jgi:hypothetical protein
LPPASLSSPPMPFTLEALIIGLARVVGSLTVLRWAFAGAIIAMAVDFSDLFMKNLLPNSTFGGLGGIEGYQSFDKTMDLAYMATFLYVAMRWNGIARSIAVGLFAFRMAGLLVFELADSRWVLLFFPNVFEFWFLFVAGRNRLKPRYCLTGQRVIAWLVVLAVLKLGQEWVLHGGRYLDKYRATDVVADWWEFLSGPF